MVNTSLEKDIQKSICEYLNLQHHFFWRQNSIPPVQRSGGQMQFRRMPPYSMNGVPDIILIKNGKFIGLEVKRENTKQSPAQKTFEIRCVTAGAEYHVVRSIDDVKKIGL